MRTKIKWAELHSPIFLAGANLEKKLDPVKRQGLILEYDEECRHLFITYTNKNNETVTGRVPEASVLHMIPGEVSKPGTAKVECPVGKIVAQVGTPQSHVFAGEGAGKTGK